MSEKASVLNGQSLFNHPCGECELSSRTFSEVSDPSELQKKCRELCQALAGDMRQEGVKVRS